MVEIYRPYVKAASAKRIMAMENHMNDGHKSMVVRRGTNSASHMLS